MPSMEDLDLEQYLALLADGEAGELSPATEPSLDPWADQAPQERHRGAAAEHRNYSNAQGELLGVPYDFEASPSDELEQFRQFMAQPRESKPLTNTAELDYVANNRRATGPNWWARTQMTPSEVQAANASVQQMNQQYDQGLEGARSKDRGGQLLVDHNPGMATLMVRAGIPQEVARGMTVQQAQEMQKWLMSGGQYLGGKNRGQDMDFTQFVMRELGDLRKGDMDRDAQMERTLLQEAGKDKRTEMTQKKKGAGGAGNPDGRKQMLAGWLAQQVSSKVGDVTLDQAQAFIDGDLAALPQQYVEPARQALVQLQGLPADEQYRTIKAALSREGLTPDMSTRTAASSGARVPDRLKVRREAAEMDRALSEASNGWRVLARNPTALQVVVSLGQQGYKGDVTDASLSPEEQAAASALLRAVSRYAFGQGGKSLTGTERDILQSGSGMSLGGAQVFKSPKDLSEFLKSLKRQRDTYKSDVAREYGPDFWEGN